MKEDLANLMMERERKKMEKRQMCRLIYTLLSESYIIVQELSPL